MEELCLTEKDFEGFGTFAAPRWLSEISIEIMSKSGEWDYEKETSNQDEKATGQNHGKE